MITTRATTAIVTMCEPLGTVGLPVDERRSGRSLRRGSSRKRSGRRRSDPCLFAIRGPGRGRLPLVTDDEVRGQGGEVGEVVLRRVVAEEFEFPERVDRL